ncbi:hypothetical protein CVT24_005707 [Panaeolus cyanescens]|uniref:Uncharacterized protein n=1 Tax=Panaeolus cyanescens TaxID=181874 RepID=A0A409VEC0_9AGAR|nr:hypothetical protein CVT24_005707 [Panaeolus cyanescens]
MKKDDLLVLGHGIYFSKPTPSANSEDTATENGESRLVSRSGRVASPAVILIFGWMGAQLSHLLKYVKPYNELYPESAKIIVCSEASFFWTGSSGRKRNLRPVAEALELLGCLPPSKKGSKSFASANIQPIIPGIRPTILVHAFSNGGSWQLATLSELLESHISFEDRPNIPLWPSALILDSCPGNGGLQATQRAFSTAIRNPIIRALSRWMIRLIYFVMYIQKAILRRKFDTLEIMKEQLNSTSLLPWFGKHTRRLYIYSTKDDIIPYHDVEKHATDAESKGFVVKRRRFDDSPHVAHAKAHPDEYWQEIQTLWDEASRSLDHC